MRTSTWSFTLRMLLVLLGVVLVAAAPAGAQTETSPDGQTETTDTEPTETDPTETEPESDEAPPPTAEDTAAERKRILQRIRQLRLQTWRWQRLMRVRLWPANRRVQSSVSLAYHRLVLRNWQRKHRVARWRALHPPRLRAWQCIHRHEGAWAANTGNGYYGGLQMDLSFQRAYGRDLMRRKGTANRWAPIEQIWVAERAYRSGRGFYPWPNTARYCGLI
jgi:hypothetical protein